MQELKEKELQEKEPEQAEVETVSQTQPREDDWEPETEELVCTGRQSRFWMGFLVGVMLVLIAVPVTMLLTLRNQKEPVPEVQTQTVIQTVTVPVEVEAPIYPPLEPNPLYPEDFISYNGYLFCTTRPAVMGIDVSTHQKKIDWEQVKAAGVKFAMLRVGHRGTDIGGIYEDELVRQHYEGASKAGLKLGYYFFSQAITPEEAEEEARFVLDIIENWQVDMPVVFDWEPMGKDARTAGMSPRTLTDCAKAFCDTIAQAGLEPMVYFNAIQSRRELYLQELADYKFWLAMYSDSMTYEHKVDMWQYTQSGKIPGIEGDVDINLYFPEY